MHTVIRTYTGTPGAAGQLKSRGRDIESLIKTAPGFIAYYLLDTPEGMTSVTVCEDVAGCEESNRMAAKWLRENMPQLAPKPPQIIHGELALRFYSKAPARA